MITIHKYPLRMSGIVDFKEADEVLAIPGLIRLLHVGEDPGGAVCVWAIVDTVREDVTSYKIKVRGTGHDCGDVAFSQHLGSLLRGPYVWHIFASEE